jgi:flavin reductase (DIM6/NTAB) family NADH-FMN oxidoreductase RutF
VAAHTLRDVLANFPAGVVVVTSTDSRGTPRGLTVSAFCSVSAEPPLVLACVDKRSQTLSAIQTSGAFTVNFLAAEHEELARVFASKQDDKFAVVPCHSPHANRGGPILDDAAAHLVCVVDRAVEAGDHWVFIAEVVETGLQDGGLLLYHRREFSRIG